MRSEQILGVLVLALGLVACSDNDNADKTLTPSATNLSGPTATAPPALIEGTAQLGPMSRQMKQTEIDAFARRVETRGGLLTQHLFLRRGRIYWQKSREDLLAEARARIRDLR